MQKIILSKQKGNKISSIVKIHKEIIELTNEGDISDINENTAGLIWDELDLPFMSGRVLYLTRISENNVCITVSFAENTFINLLFYTDSPIILIEEIVFGSDTHYNQIMQTHLMVLFQCLPKPL